MLVRPTVCFRHQHSILSQRRGLQLPLTHRFLVFDVAASRLRRRTSTARYLGHRKRVRQSRSNQVDSISAPRAIARSSSFTVDSHMPTNDRSGCQASSLEEAAKEQPSINA